MVLLVIFLLTAPLLFGQSETNVLPKLAPPYGEIPPTFWQRHGAAMVAGGGALIVIVGLVLWRICRPKPPLVVPPVTQAREALANWLNRSEDGACLSSVSQILRRYISATFDLPAGELTTEEFSAAIAGQEKIGGELAQIISGFLRECDRRKFSPANVATPFNAASRALELVALAEKIRDRRDARLAEK